MNKDNTKRLFTDFSRLFRGRTEPGTQTRMCDGFGCGDGWFDLIYQLSAQITKHARECGLDPKAAQVKEKFGGLRFYVHNADEAMEQMIEEAERRSKAICENCGAPTKILNRDGWFSTVCSGCTSKFAKRKKIFEALTQPLSTHFNKKNKQTDKRETS